MSRLDEIPEEEAAKCGCHVVYPEDNQLLIDLDTPGNRETMMDGIRTFLKNGISIEIEKETVSRGGNTHVYLRVYKIRPTWKAPFVLTPEERITLQSLLGSDPKREALSLLRVWLETGRPPTVFFELL